MQRRRVSSGSAALCAVVLLTGCAAQPLGTRERSTRGDPALENRDETSRPQEETPANQHEEIARNQELLEELRRRNLDVRETPRGVVVNLPDVLFEFDRADLTRDARRTVGDIAVVVLRSARGRQVSIEGHTDSIGTQAYNQRLSGARAESVADALVGDGVNRRRLRPRGFGKTRPVAPNTIRGRDNPEGRARNRRVEVIIENARGARGDDGPGYEQRRRDVDGSLDSSRPRHGTPRADDQGPEHLQRSRRDESECRCRRHGRPERADEGARDHVADPVRRREQAHAGAAGVLG
jgi:outer membrane protein OmpA-like peptidoglycan-associated protein